MAELNKVVVRTVHRRRPITICVLKLQGFLKAIDDNRMRCLGWVRQDDPVLGRSQSGSRLVVGLSGISSDNVMTERNGVVKLTMPARLLSDDADPSMHSTQIILAVPRPRRSMVQNQIDKL